MFFKSFLGYRGCSSLEAKAAIAGTTLAAAITVAGLTGATRAGADVVTIANPIVIPATVNLSAGTTDWADFGGPSSATNAITPTFNSAANTAFSNVIDLDSSTLMGWAAPSPYPLFSWSNGTPTATATNSDEYAIDKGNAVGDSLQFTQNVAGNSSELVRVYVSSFDNGSGTVLPVSLTARLGNDSPVTNSSNMPFVVDADHQDGVYGISIQNTLSSSQVLTVTFTQTTASGSTGIYAVSASPVPEPAALGLVGVGAMGLLMLKRRRNAV